MIGLDFEEYLWAIGYDEQSTNTLRWHFQALESLPDEVHQNMLRLFREFMAIGGMPAVVQSFADSQNYSTTFSEQEMILNAYLDDIAKFAGASVRNKARECYLSIPRQLAKENTKFKYGVVKKGGTARKFETALDWLRDANIIFICLREQLKLGLPVYTFDVTCAEDARAQLGHGYRWVVLNASAWEELPVGRLRSVLKYVATGEDDKTDSLIGAISDECAKLNEDEVWKKESRAMMTLQHDLAAREYHYRTEGRKQGLAEGRAEGLAEGRAEGRAETAALFAALVAAGRADDIIRAANDEAYCEQLYQEFQL